MYTSSAGHTASGHDQSLAGGATLMAVRPIACGRSAAEFCTKLCLNRDDHFRTLVRICIARWRHHFSRSTFETLTERRLTNVLRLGSVLVWLASLALELDSESGPRAKTMAATIVAADLIS